MSRLSATGPAIIVIFPTARRIGKVRQAARALTTARTDREGNARWRQIVEAIAARLETLSLPHEAIEREIDAFRDAVRDELGRRRDADHGPQRG